MRVIIETPSNTDLSDETNARRCDDFLDVFVRQAIEWKLNGGRSKTVIRPETIFERNMPRTQKY
jgi:hypothetical protein